MERVTRTPIRCPICEGEGCVKCLDDGIVYQQTTETLTEREGYLETEVERLREEIALLKAKQAVQAPVFPHGYFPYAPQGVGSYPAYYGPSTTTTATPASQTYTNSGGEIINGFHSKNLDEEIAFMDDSTGNSDEDTSKKLLEKRSCLRS